MLRKLTFLFLVFVSTYYSQAQSVPGYLGKRISVQYNLYTFLSSANPSSKEPKQPQIENGLNNFGINLQHHFNIEYVVSKRTSLITSAGYSNSYIHPYIMEYTEGLTSEFPKMTAFDINLGIKFYAQHFAPLGVFYEIRLGVASAKASDFHYLYHNYNDPPDSPYHSGMVEGGLSSLSPQVGFALGINRIVKDVLIFSYGIDINLPVIGMINSTVWGDKWPILQDSNSINLRGKNSEENQENLSKQALGRYAAQSLINFRVGIGIIL